jgi:hypothetical protein
MRTPLALALAAVLVCAAGCQTIFGLDDPDPVSPDAAPDAPVGDPKLCWGTEDRICLLSAPAQAGPKTLGGTLDTSTSSMCDPSSTTYCVIAANVLTVGSTNVTGARPLVLIGADSIVVEGALDAASHAGKPGPGAAGASCPTFASNPTSNRGGGAGGSLAGQGGLGGDADNAVGGMPAAIVMPIGLRAGCRGQDGGGAATHGGTGGLGGGVAYLIAGRLIEVKATAKVNASGAAGNGATCTGSACSANPGTGETGGGGGGGAGGVLIFEAPSITSNGLIFADGGGGGEGSSGSNNGRAGTDPDGTKRAPGGAGGANNGGDGGLGSYAAVPNGSKSPDDATSSLSDPGGGGGGGGAGLIRIYGARSITGGVVSPAPDVR